MGKTIQLTAIKDIKSLLSMEKKSGKVKSSKTFIGKNHNSNKIKTI